jgi:hypothetical protein
VPGKGFFAILRLYGPEEAVIDKTGKPGEIQAIMRRARGASLCVACVFRSQGAPNVAPARL